MKPLVSVICISYNHAPFVKEALDSVFNQDYENVEVIILDDGSSDSSRSIIGELVKDREVQLALSDSNQGYTKTFNKGLAMAKGEYIVDFALDDVMLPEFLKESVQKFDETGSKTGVVFSNADYINAKGKVIDNHNELLFKKGMIDSVPEGDVFNMVLKRYFICTPTMVIKREVFERLEGYDESLAYEDFDFWVRSSRYWEYAYVDEVMLKKRKLNNSMSTKRYDHQRNQQLKSTLEVCKKAATLCKNKAELKSLSVRLNYEYRQCVRNSAWDLCKAYYKLVKQYSLRLEFPSIILNWFGLRLRLHRDKFI